MADGDLEDVHDDGQGGVVADEDCQLEDAGLTESIDEPGVELVVDAVPTGQHAAGPEHVEVVRLVRRLPPGLQVGEFRCRHADRCPDPLVGIPLVVAAAEGGDGEDGDLAGPRREGAVVADRLPERGERSADGRSKEHREERSGERAVLLDDAERSRRPWTGGDAVVDGALLVVEVGRGQGSGAHALRPPASRCR